MIGINAKKHIQCQKCYCEFESVVGNNSLYICPKCNDYACCECNYGFGSITPCKILVTKLLARSSSQDKFIKLFL